MHVTLDVFRCGLKITTLIKITVIFKKHFKRSFCYQNVVTCLGNSATMLRGQHGMELSIAMTQGLLLLASKAGDKNTLTPGRATHRRRESKMFPWAEDGPWWSVLSSSHQKYYFPL